MNVEHTSEDTMASDIAAEQSAPATTTSSASASASTSVKPRPRGKGAPHAATTSAGQLNHVRIACLTNAHYHAVREAFLDTVHRWFMFALVVLGAGALLDIVPHVAAVERTSVEIGFRELFALTATVIATLDLTFDLSNRARTHSLMRRLYHELSADVLEGIKTVHQAEVCLDRFSGDEEPVYRVVFLASWNLAQETIYGDDADQFVIPAWDRFWKNFFHRPDVRYSVKKLKDMDVK